MESKKSGIGMTEEAKQARESTSGTSNAADRKEEPSNKTTEAGTNWGWYILAWIIGGVVFGVLSGSAWVGVLWPILLFGVLMVFGAISQCLKR